MGRLLEGTWGPGGLGFVVFFPKTRNTRACVCADRIGNGPGRGTGWGDAWIGFRAQVKDIRRDEIGSKMVWIQVNV